MGGEEISQTDLKNIFSLDWAYYTLLDYIS